MRSRAFQLSPLHRRVLYAVTLLLWVSGAAWAWVHHLDESGQATAAMRDAKSQMVRIHGLAAPVFVLLIGTLLPVHVVRCWQARRNRVNGVFLLSAVGVLTISGFLLYYLADEASREASSRLHLWLGLALPVLLVSHIVLGRRVGSREF